MPTYQWNDDHQALELVPGTFNYRSKWACFDCRKSFTRVRPTTEPDKVLCPDCKEKAVDMGHLFEAPPKRDVRSWKVAEVLGKNQLKYRTAGNVAFLNYMITGNGKCSPEEVARNIKIFLKIR